MSQMLRIRITLCIREEQEEDGERQLRPFSKAFSTWSVDDLMDRPSSIKSSSTKRTNTCQCPLTKLLTVIYRATYVSLKIQWVYDVSLTIHVVTRLPNQVLCALAQQISLCSSPCLADNQWLLQMEAVRRLMLFPMTQDQMVLSVVCRLQVLTPLDPWTVSWCSLWPPQLACQPKILVWFPIFCTRFISANHKFSGQIFYRKTWSPTASPDSKRKSTVHPDATV